MARKRRDKKRDPSTLERLSKVSVTALAVGAGAVFLSRNKSVNKFLTDTASPLLKSTKGFKKDLIGRDKKNLMTYYRAYQKNFGKNRSKLRDEIKRRKTSPLALNVKNSKAIREALEHKQFISKTGYKALEKNKRIAGKILARQELYKYFLQSKKYKHLTEDNARQIVKNVYDKLDDEAIASKIIDEMIPKTMEGIGIERTDFNEIFTLINEVKKKSSPKTNSLDPYLRKNKDLFDSLKGHRTREESAFDKIDKFFKKFLDVDMNSEKFITGSKAATIGDLEDNLDKFDFESPLYEKMNVTAKKPSSRSKRKEFDYDTFIQTLKDMYGEENYRNVVLDPSIRIKDGANGPEFFSIEEMSETAKNIKNEFKDTLPGQILAKGFDDKRGMPDIAIIPADTKSAFARARTFDIDEVGQAFKEDRERNISSTPSLYMDGYLYDMRENADGKITIDFDSGQRVKMVSGYKHRVLNELLGTTDEYKPEAFHSELAKKLGLVQDGKFNPINHLMRSLTKFEDPNWEFNQIESIESIYLSTASPADTVKDMRSLGTAETEISKYKSRLHRNEETVAALLNKKLTGITDETMEAIIDSGNITEKQRDMLQALMDGDITFYIKAAAFDEAGNYNLKDIKNDKLRSIVNNLITDTKATLDSTETLYKKGAALPILELEFDSSTKLNLEGQLRIETVKDILLNKQGTDDAMFNWIDELNVNDIPITSKDNAMLKSMGTLAVFEDRTHLGTISNFTSAVNSLYENTDYTLNTELELNPQMKNIFENDLGSIKSDFGLFSIGYNKNLNEEYGTDYTKYGLIHMSSASQIFTYNINEGIKFNAQALKDTVRELNAGRNDPEHITELTINLQYLLSRLSYGIEGEGLGLSANDMGSPLETVKNIALKRLLPAAAIYQGYNVLNYESQKLTGTSIPGAFANSLANIDIAGRRLIEHTPLYGALNSLAESSVIHEYYFGDRHFNTAEEEQEYYETGYSSVRKGRFWSFGSASEYRGGSITYWEPNYLKRANSDWKDAGIYGSIDNRWAHSWIPTPQHPLAPIRRLLNPYWLEKYHLKENDRPYPLTGKMFTEGTAWGAVLNPTIGQILKPVKMLPQVKRRLGRDGRDSVAIIENLNNRIKQRAKENDDLMVVNGTDIRNAEYVPYGNPDDDELNVTISNGRATVQGMNYMDQVKNIREYEPPDGVTYTNDTIDYNSGTVSRKQQYIVSKAEKFVNELDRSSYNATSVTESATNIIKKVNTAIKRKSKHARRVDNSTLMPDKREGTFVYRNLANERLNYDNQYYSDHEIKKMVDRSVYKDYARDVKHSIKDLTGIYGFLSDQVFGTDTYTYRFANAGEMTSFSRGFWDSNIGGLGGELMEIARRFFPNTDKSRVSYNPLRNNMPDWIPDTYHYGDPYVEIPKGEMRLPGKGYEAMYDLHPDQFGKYGAFDRYKILADIAPNSTEFKKWKNIAKNTVTDPNLVKEMEDIGVRASKMSGNHEFFDYKYIRNNLEYRKGRVQGISNGQIILAGGETLTLAGLNVNNQTTEALKEYLKPGQKITYRTYKDKKIDLENTQRITEAVVYSGSSNINERLLNEGYAEKNKEDNSALGITGTQSGSQEVMGGIQEVIAHAPLPYVHSKFLKVETPLESYKNELYYGHPFNTWDHPIKGFVTPAFNKNSGKSLAGEAVALGYAYLHFSKIAGKTNSKLLSNVSTFTMATLNPASFLGIALGYATRLSNGKIEGNGGSSLTNAQKGAAITTAISAVKYGWDNADNPLKAATTFAFAGSIISHNLKGVNEFAREAFNKELNFLPGDFKAGAKIGALVGLGVSAIKNSHFDKDKIFSTKFVPKETKKRWDIDEYYDRMEYVKYMGLYKKAARKAELFEHSNIRSTFKELDKNKEKIAKLDRKATKLATKNSTNEKIQSKLAEIQQQRQALEEQNNMFFKGGKYTQSAVAYKKKAESTLYGLSPTSTKDELLAAVPDEYKDHFQAFMDVTDKHEQKQILKYMPDYLKRPLQISWGQKPDKMKSNYRYFKRKNMPSMFWKGWKPNVNLKYVKMKTIQNEGMMLSDFGYYESEKAKPMYEAAPSIDDYNNNSGQLYRTNLLTSLHGMGIGPMNISVKTTSAPGLWIYGDVKSTVSDATKVAGYKVATAAQTLSSLIF